MADTVRYLMEEMIPELEDMEKKGYFSRAEVKAIAQKRQDFEYALKRRAALKRDFLRYIDYEAKLEQLRRYRKKQRGIKAKRGLAELGIVRRIHFIYERATRKFKADLSLWIAWLDYCKSSKSTKQFSKVVTKALHRHSHVAALWIEASVWEFEHTANVAAARALMQRGLRHCPKDETLWSEYCRLELLYVARLRARREVLGLPNPETPEDCQHLTTKVKRKRVQGTETTTDDVDGDGGPSDVQGQGTDEEAAVRGVLTGAVVRVVIKEVTSACPESLTLRMRLLRVLGQFSFPGVSQLLDYVYEDVEGRFAEVEDGWDVLARRDWSGGLDKQGAPHMPGSDVQTTEEGGWELDIDSHNRCCGVYARGLERVCTSRMHELFVRYLGQRTLPLLAPAAGGDARAIELLGVLGAQLLAAYQSALKAGKATEQLCAAWVDWALALGQPKVAVKAAKAACDVFKGAVPVWLRRVRLELELHKRGQRTSEQLVLIFQEGLAAVPAADGAELWQVALEAVPPGSTGHEALQGLLLSRLAGQAKGPMRGGLGEVVGSLVRGVRRAQGLDACRGIVERLLVLPPAGGEWFHAALDVELQELGLLEVVVGTPSVVGSVQVGAGQVKGRSREKAQAIVKRLFEAAVSAYGSMDVGLWLRYAAFEQASGKGAGGVYWRATKTLAEPDMFVEQYREMMGVTQGV